MEAQRIVIVGTSGSGKTTLGEHLADLLDCPQVDLDALHWEADWTPAPQPVFRQRVAQALAVPRWVVSGNYQKVRDLTWEQADTLVWLDYPLLLVFWRLFRRALRRIISGEELWSGNRETWRGQFFSRDSLFLWALKSAPRHRREYPILFTQPEYSHLRVYHFKSPRQLQSWLEKFHQDFPSTPVERV